MVIQSKSRNKFSISNYSKEMIMLNVRFRFRNVVFVYYRGIV